MLPERAKIRGMLNHPIIGMRYAARVILMAMAFASLASCKTIDPRWRDTGVILAKRVGLAAGAAVLNAAVSQLDRENKGDYLQGLSKALWTSAPDVINADTVEEIARTWTPNKTHWEALADALATDFAEKQPKTREEALELLYGYAKGIYEATEK